MDETGELLTETARRLFEQHCTAAMRLEAEQGVWPAKLWAALEDTGLPRALVPESAGGFGVKSVDALGLIREAGRHAAPVPLAETMMASWALAGAGLAVPEGPLTILPVHPGDRLTITRHGEGWHLSGTARRVPWGRDAGAAAALVERDDGRMLVALVPSQGWQSRHGVNLAGEARDELTIAATLDARAVAEAAPGVDFATLRRLGAAMRVMAMAGALEKTLEMTVQYAQERVQFGRPIGKFQAIQQNLAILAGQATAAGAAADIAAETVDAGLPMIPVAAAKTRAGEAASIAAGIAHQVHGAIGFTQEHALHFLTKRLWSWRDEFGNEAEWSLALGRLAAARGADCLWSDIIAA
jgi:acyl-CoA dehydrogenase